jgi:hypothetical protein
LTRKRGKRPLLFFTLVGRIPIHSPNISQSYPNINDMASGSFVYIFATRHKRRIVDMFTDLRRSTDLSHSAGMFTDLRRSNRSVYLPTSSGRETPVGVVLRNTGYRTTAHRHGVSSIDAPAQTSIICSSAPEPLLALGVEVPEPPSPEEHVCSPGPPCRAPPPCC